VTAVTGCLRTVTGSRTPPPPSAERTLVLSAMGRGIALLHNAGVLHGDLTTSNVMVRGVDHTPGAVMRLPVVTSGDDAAGEGAGTEARAARYQCSVVSGRGTGGGGGKREGGSGSWR
jgi:hypothetical protein